MHEQQRNNDISSVQESNSIPNNVVKNVQAKKKTLSP